MRSNEQARYSVVYVANGQLEAETIRLFLEAHGVSAFIFQEGLGTTYGFTVGPLGEARVVVPAEQMGQAIELLKRMEQGEFDVYDATDSGSDQEPIS